MVTSQKMYNDRRMKLMNFGRITYIIPVYNLNGLTRVIRFTLSEWAKVTAPSAG